MTSRSPARRVKKRPRGAPASELRALAATRGGQPPRLQDKLREPRSRWQRFVRYTWDKNRGRG